MNLKENKNNYYTKELNELDRYLIRIIKRYFSLEETNNADGINAIITEAMARYKGEISYKRSGVDVLNNKTGITNININDLNGEKLFEKLTAFNKDFGIDADTICMGNDERLSDKRTPTKHHHKVSNINDISEYLKEVKKEIVKYGYHYHNNLAILNKLKYTGTNTQIDLVKLESLGFIINTLLNTLELKRANLISVYNSDKQIIDDLINQIYLFIQGLYNYIETINKNTNKLLTEYVYAKSKELETIKENVNNDYSDIDNLEDIIQIINNSILTVSTQEISLAEMLNVIDEAISSDNEDSMLNMYTNSSVIGIDEGLNGDIITTYTDKADKWEYNSSLKAFICRANLGEHLMLLSADKYKCYTHEVTVSSSDSDNDTLTIVLAVYRIGNAICTLSLNVSTGTEEFTGNQHKMAVVLSYNTGSQEVIISDNTFETTEGWSNKKVKLKIERMESKFKIYRSNVNSDIVNNVPCMDFDISEMYGNIFNDASEFGYGCFSQKDSIFSDIKFTGYKEIILSGDIEKEQDINFSMIPSNYVSDSIEIESELVYNNIRTKMPYITDDFIISTGITQNKLYAKFQLLKSNVVLPFEIANGKIEYNIYSKINIT